jgi:hypothetical protein
VEWGYYPKIPYIYQKKDMPKEVKVVDKTWRNRPFGQEGIMKDPNNKNKIHTEKTTSIKRGGKLKKEAVGVVRKGAIYMGEPDTEETATISKYDKSGNLKKTVSISKDATGTIKKTVSRNGKEAVSVKPGLLANRRIKKYI